ncbi:hypothetical protein ACE1OE_01130 [Vibrio sp. E150_011]
MKDVLIPLLPEGTEFAPDMRQIKFPTITLEWQNEEPWKDAFDFYQLRLNQIDASIKPLLPQTLEAK